MTRQRTGSEGKLVALKASTTSQFILSDDSPAILQEIQGANQIALRIRKFRQRAVLDLELVSWSLSADWVVDRFERFIRYHSQ